MIERTTTAGILIRNGRVLVGKRVEGGAIGGKWEFPGGKNRWGESLDDTIRREWQEEMGVSVHMTRELMTYDFVNKDTQYHLKALLVEAEDNDFKLRMHSALEFVDAEKLMTLDLAESDRHVRDFLIREKMIR